MEQNTELQRQISATILQLRLRAPFFATLTLFAQIEITTRIPTAATDGKNIFLNANFWQTLTPKQRLGLIAHEVLHAALLHVPRCGTREPLMWNIAADIVVNGMVLAQEGLELPPGHIRDTKLEHLSVEEIYHILQTQARKYTLHVGDLLPMDGPGHPTYAELEQHWRQALQHAKTLAEMLGQGNFPLGMERELSHLNPAQLDWRSYLWRFLVQTPNDFQGFDRRFVGRGLYLETLQGESVRVYIAVDTSGSIDNKLLSLFLSEVRGILQAYPHLEAHLYYADASCYGPYELTSQDPSHLPKPVGGGGTSFRPFFEAIEKEHDPNQAGVCVYLTDGYGTFPEQEGSLPVLWVLTPGGISLQTVPFGEAVRLV
ncbi:DUF2201 family putative metallopeptidase [Ktedonobacter racemifer]|uniref:Metallopeptidase domain-containing protein n=1 Tax=Ktedonobacter racemifer DSM 44963 TaxID=485913 RepID=D6U751_KTERA|nr:VWA-like domain-containing protein [Ktedonobacter racemifer]EFH79712.1 Protein of unknown function DUF2201, metallopeptidase-related [Ktedonobacter racemifer DSM 44963]